MENGSITIPCTYTYREDLPTDTQYTVHWGKPEGQYCLNIKEEIINSSGNVIGKYKGRLSKVQDPTKKHKEFITIKGLKRLDGPIICCEVTRTKDSSEYTWSDNYGTYLHFTGDQSISQLDELIAVPGEEITIPCYYPQETTQADKTVTWYIGDKELCALNKDTIYTSDEPHRSNGYSLINFPTDVSLRIHRFVGSGFTQYCCQVTTINGTLTSRRATELVSVDSAASSQFIVNQPNNIIADTEGSVTLNCSYSYNSDRDVLWVNIYWRINSTHGSYAYHPYQEMVHPSYRGRTNITGSADLHIQGVKKADNASYYCFVMIKRCAGPNQYLQTISYGEGTRLIVKEIPAESLKNLIIISISASAILIILCVVLIVLKATGIICKKKRRPSDLKVNMNDLPDKDGEMCEEMPYCEISIKSPEQELADDNDEVTGQGEMESRRTVDGEDGEDESPLYAKLNKTKLEQKNPTPHPVQGEEIVYSTVLGPTSQYEVEI
ncbi:uncharacterized protein LOC142149709 [Mixophyes fleayi]|uniref:uncharacterized protein LOC142149709 n=1 Tax=Mixophyes fleayi TaxID=3061075 RepID=UPI003F4D9F0F